ncbi:hypothetical protein GR28A_00043 [Vibrio phage vB_VcorM_GR28A]|nr:hypothetical protein GR28A_00043 [Vibrio phage vB_VcorM_GR28A]
MYMLFSRDGESHNLMIECRRDNDGRPIVNTDIQQKIIKVIHQVEGDLFRVSLMNIRHSETNGAQAVTVKYNFQRKPDSRPVVVVDAFVELKEIG